MMKLMASLFNRIVDYTLNFDWWLADLQICKNNVSKSNVEN